MATAARPRPRPVPRVKPTPTASSSATNEHSLDTPVAVEDDDAMFLRNKGRSAQTWKNLDKITKAKPKKTVRSESEGDSDSPHPKKQKKKVIAGSAQAKIERLMSETMSDGSGSDSDVVEVTGVSGAQNKRKKRRSRSRSITPPPSVAKHQLQAARDLVRRALNTTSAPRAPSPTTFDDADESTDTIIFDPELQKIARSVAAEAQRAPSEPVEVDPTDTLEITVKWQPHPLNESGKSTISVFKLNRTDNFHELFEAVADDESILTGNLVMAYRGVQLYPSVTPAALNLWGDAELVACDKTTWEYMRTHPNASSSAEPEPDVSDTEAATPNNAAAAEVDSETESDADAGGETFKLCLRSAITKKDIIVTVRPTTTCGAIVQAFLRKAGLADQYSRAGGRKSVGGSAKKGKGKKGEPDKDPQLVIDGDRMASNVPIGDADLDDGDVVDVVGL